MTKEKEYILSRSTSEVVTRERTPKGYQATTSNSFFFAMQQQSSLHVLSGKVDCYTKNVFDIIKEYDDKEVLYVRAIKNLLKQRSYHDLVYELDNEYISEEDFSNELENNEEKYLIRINDKLDIKKIKLLSNILNKLKANLTDDDLSEIFSIRTNNLSKLVLTSVKMLEDEGGI